MDKRSGNGRQAQAKAARRSEAEALLAALGTDPWAHDLPTRAAFLALAEEVLFLREDQAHLRRALCEAERLADHDALCPVFNRRAFERELNREIALSARHETPLCLLYVDLDRFKLVNDRFGHACGDEALKQVCDIILSQVRQTDIVGRLGGDEFGVILTHAELADAQLKADRLTDRIDRIRFGRGDEEGPAPVQLGASCGVVAWKGQASAELFIAEADEAMFRAKAARRGGRL